jgi:hypothetical protein
MVQIRVHKLQGTPQAKPMVKTNVCATNMGLEGKAHTQFKKMKAHKFIVIITHLKVSNLVSQRENYRNKESQY